MAIPLCMKDSIGISILLPTRGRTAQLARSIESLLTHAANPEGVEWRLAFDDDDADSLDYFMQHIRPEIEQSGAEYTVMGFAPLGYERLHEYVNALAESARGSWLVFWNDDAVMQDPGWDTTILSQGDNFCVQAFDTHRQHPYSIFPIVPRRWYEVLGHLSQHQLNDAWISQIAWMLDIMVRIPIRVAHERYDLTGTNLDDTYRRRRIFEGNPRDPRDFNYPDTHRQRIAEAKQLAAYLRDQGQDMSHWDEVIAGRRDPWQKMLAMDINNQMRRLNP